MFLVFIVERLFLNLPALVLSFHGSQDAATCADAIEFLQDGLFNQIGKLLDVKTSLVGILGLRPTKLVRDNELNRHRSPNALIGRSRDCLVIGVRMERITVIKISEKGL